MDTRCDILRNTEKLYYQDQYLMSASSKVIRVHAEAIELDRTVAYPEGGGQEGDIGTIELPVGTVRFIWTKKLYGTPIRLEGFKGGRHGGIILHIIHPDDLFLFESISEGMQSKVTIDIQRRERLTMAHSASHFLYAAAIELREGLEDWTLGCHIKERSARFDFFVETPFLAAEVREIERRANELIAMNGMIENYAFCEIEEARMWRYQDLEIPCGGTHVKRPLRIGNLTVRRKRLGRNKERLCCEFPSAMPDFSLYHEQAQ